MMQLRISFIIVNNNVWMKSEVGAMTALKCRQIQGEKTSSQTMLSAIELNDTCDFK